MKRSKKDVTLLSEGPVPDADNAQPFMEPALKSPRLNPGQQNLLRKRFTQSNLMRDISKNEDMTMAQKIRNPHPRLSDFTPRKKPQVFIERNEMWGELHAPENSEWLFRIEMTDWNQSEKRFVPRVEVCEFHPPVLAPYGSVIALIWDGLFPKGLRIIHGGVSTDHYGIKKSRFEYTLKLPRGCSPPKKRR